MSLSNLYGLLPRRTHSAEETHALGHSLAQHLPEGTVLALLGDLGAGKTQLVKGLVAGLGGDPMEVTSPTFSIAQEYEVDEGFLLHVDAYRTRNEREFVEMGLTEYMERAWITAVEWPDQLGAALPPDALVLKIDHAGKSERIISLKGKP